MLPHSVNTGLSMAFWTERQRLSTRFAFDLNLMHAKSYVAPSRVCLIGDGKCDVFEQCPIIHYQVIAEHVKFIKFMAARTIHPMAGQGLNLRLADAECLARKIHVESSMGIKDKAELQFALQQYNMNLRYSRRWFQ